MFRLSITAHTPALPEPERPARWMAIAVVMCEQVRRQVFNDNRISIGRFNSFISPANKTSIVLVRAGIFHSNQISMETRENCYASVNEIKLMLQLLSELLRFNT